MLGHQPYYHGLTKKIIVSFGQIFSDIKIQRFNKSNVREQLIDVPISYGNRDKWYQRLTEESEIKERVLISLPRIGFEIVGIQYDPSRKLNKFTQYRMCGTTLTGNVLSAYSPVPYTLTFNLYILTKSQDDMFQIVEQIIPFFAPQYNLTINAIPEMQIVQDIPVTLSGVNISDSYEGPMADRREVIGTLTFTAKAEYFGPTSDIAGKLITKVITKIDPMGGDLAREVDVIAIGTIDNYTTIENHFDIPRPV